MELGYIVRSDLWSQAYATEIAAAVVEHAFSVLALPELVGFTRPENLRSRRVLEKLAFAYERTFVANGEESVLYRRRNPYRSVPQNAPSSSALARNLGLAPDLCHLPLRLAGARCVRRALVEYAVEASGEPRAWRRVAAVYG